MNLHSAEGTRLQLSVKMEKIIRIVENRYMANTILQSDSFRITFCWVNCWVCFPAISWKYFYSFLMLFRELFEMSNVYAWIWLLVVRSLIYSFQQKQLHSKLYKSPWDFDYRGSKFGQFWMGSWKLLERDNSCFRNCILFYQETVDTVNKIFITLPVLENDIFCNNPRISVIFQLIEMVVKYLMIIAYLPISNNEPNLCFFSWKETPCIFSYVK